MVGDGETFLTGNGWEGFFVLGEPGEPDERNDCPLNGFFGTFLSSQKGRLKFLFPSL